jgi:hypothetical protein
MHLELDAVPPGANDSEHRSTVANATLTIGFQTKRPPRTGSRGSSMSLERTRMPYQAAQLAIAAGIVALRARARANQSSG